MASLTIDQPPLLPWGLFDGGFSRYFFIITIQAISLYFLKYECSPPFVFPS